MRPRNIIKIAYFFQAPMLILTLIIQQVLSILTLAGLISDEKNLVLEDAFNQNMLGSFLLVRSLFPFFIAENNEVFYL
jgi:hypothetical protein